MPTNAQIGDVSEELSTTVTELRSFLERASEEEKARGEQSVETKAAVEAIDARIDELEVSLKRRIQEYDARHNGTAGLDEAKAAERKAFEAFMRKGEESMAPEDRKALSSDSDPDGGFLVSENVRQGILEVLRETSPIRELATVETISSGDSLTFHVEVGDFDAGWVSEREARPATNTGTTGKETIYAHEIYAAPRASQQILDDSAYDLESWIQRKVADKFARVENTAFVNGDGEGKPFGILTDTRIATVNSGAAAALTADGLIDLIYDLPEFYAANASFLLKRVSLKAVRKFKDAQGQYLWTQGFDKTPATILGYGYREATDMPTIGAGAKAVIFGDFRRGYVVLDRQQVRVLRDPYTAKPFVEFYTTKRVGGKVVLPEALRTQTIAA